MASEYEPGINSQRILISSVVFGKILHSHSVSLEPDIRMSWFTAKGNPAMD